MATLVSTANGTFDQHQSAITFPTNAPGDLLIVAAATDSIPIFNFTAAFREIVNQNHSGSTCKLGVWWRIADGTEPDIVAMEQNLGAIEALAWIAIAVTGVNAASAPEVAILATETTATPNPPSITASWGSEENLFLAFLGWDANPTLTSVPSGYTTWSNSHVVNQANGSGVAFGAKLATAATDDPGVFTISASEQAVSATMVVRLAA